jgi:hypothetical protein
MLLAGESADHGGSPARIKRDRCDFSKSRGRSLRCGRGTAQKKEAARKAAPVFIVV